MNVACLAFSQAWSYTAARAHIRVLHEVAANASHDVKNRRHVLAQFYDEVARKEWAEQSKRGAGNFDPRVCCLKVDRDLLEMARIEYDDAMAPKAKVDGYEQPSGSSGQSSGSSGHGVGKGNARGSVFKLADRAVRVT